MASYDDKDLAATGITPVAVVDAHDVESQPDNTKYDTLVDVHTGLYDGVHRGMEQRHLQMYALAGTLGTGLFLTSGKAISHGGPAGALLAYITMGAIIFSMNVCLGEMATYAPISGGYLHFAERWLHPSVGFALGWQGVLGGCVSNASEVVAAAILISFWDTGFSTAHQVGYIIALIVVCGVINFLGVRWFGESEFWFALIKIALIVGLILAGLIVDLGGGPNHDRIGFRYWKDPGAFNAYVVPGSTGKFLGWFANLITAAYSFSGIEFIGMAAAEVKNPRVSIPKAVRRLFIRLTLFYVLGILIVGMLVPSNDPKLLQSTGTAASSPFVLAFSRAGIKVLPSIINAAVLTSAVSACSTGIFNSSRKLYGLALRGQGPSIFARTTAKGLPWVAVSFVSFWMLLAFLSLSDGSNAALEWLSNITTLASFINWMAIAATFIRFKKGLEAQGIDRKSLHYYSSLQPFHAWFCLIALSIIVFFSGWKVFIHGHWSAPSFVSNYLNLPFFFVLMAGYALIKRDPWLRPEQLDFFSNIPTDDEVAYEEPPPKNTFMKVVNYVFT
ncbi:hypothetical protein Q8F55_004433 [Vanrija albida]|uniref:Amino acid permease/ SLC12A domain-containing protein n=1 Tax=Vanrija albida TaxID=181172 RepID=A0ABR3Q7I1_9TREE